MQIKIERAVCAECGNYIRDDEIALFRQGEILCEHHLKQFFKDSFGDALDWVLDGNVTHGRDFSKKYIAAEERVVYPRGDES